EGQIEIRAGIMPIDQARPLDTWNVSGMRGTGSHDLEFDDVFIPTDWTFLPLAAEPEVGDVFGAIPLWAQIGTGLASCAVGNARNMLDRFRDLAVAKVPTGGVFTTLAERASAQIAMGEAEGLYLAARAVLHETVDLVWERGVAGEPFDDEALARQR